MCFQFSKRTKKLVAKRNIPCYKLVQSVSEVNGIFRAAYNSHYLYTTSVRPSEVKIRVASFMDIDEINEGYHSYKRKSDVIDLIDKRKSYHEQTREALNVDTDRLIEFIIPKGTIYYANNHEYVSERIEMKENEYD